MWITSCISLGALYITGCMTAEEAMSGFIVTQFMLNRAVNQIFTPICLLTCQSLGANPIGLLLLVSAGSLTAFLTPMATPAVAMCMKEGGYDLKSIFKSGAVITVLLSVVYIFYTMTVYPAF